MKVLIAVVCSGMNEEKLEEKLTEFEQAGYRVYFFGNSEEQVESMIDLPSIINYVKKDAGEIIQRFVVLSNISEFIFAWYRCYNSLADEFIYYLDEHTDFENIGIINKIPHQEFYEKLYNFDNIAQEENQGKIYITIDFSNFRKIGNFLTVNSNFRFFDDYRNFNFTSNHKKKMINKCYFYKGLQYEFVISENADKKDEIRIDVNNSPKNLILNQEACQEWGEHYHLLGYILLTIFEIFENEPKQRNTILIFICTTVKLQSHHAKNYLYQYFIDYFNEKDISFYTKISLISLLVALEIKEEIYHKIIELLLDDDQHIENHYPLLASSCIYRSQYGLPDYQNIYHDREAVLTKIINYYKENLVTKALPMHKKNCIMIHSTQLLALQHSPTLWTLNYAKYLKRYYPEYEVKIFVDDIFCYHPSEVVFPFVGCSEPSVNFRKIHEEILQGLDIDIYYSDHTKDRQGRLQEDLAVIDEFSPSVILGISTWFNIIRGFLYDRYPIIDITVGGLSNSQQADLFIHSYEEAYIEQECIKYNYNLENLQKGKIERYRGGVDFPAPITIIKRKKYKISIEDFVMVTVGNRLDGEMDEQFIDIVCSFLRAKSNVKWVIVGKAKLPYLMKNYSELANKQMIFIEHTDDLAALYKLCDIYLNPFRKHGGYSAAMAMNQEVPIVTLCTSDDVVAFVGEENSTRNHGAYCSEIQRLYDDSNYKKTKGQLMKRRLEEEFSFKNSINDIVKAFKKAILAFEKRI